MIEALGLSLPLLLLFVSFGFMVGVLFGFFGMGGAFLITPTLLILDYPASVAIGSGLAFYFGTSVIAVMKHYDIGQVNYKLGAILFVGLTIGIEGGRILVFGLEELGIAELVTGAAYVFLLAGIGILFLKRAAAVDSGSTDERDSESERERDGDTERKRDSESERERDGDAEASDRTDGDDIPEIAQKIQSYNLPPMISLVSGGRASLWTISGVGSSVGLVSGLLGVGGGFIRMPAIYYLIGTPLGIAVGTSLFAGLFSGAFGTFTYGLSGSVDVVVVSTLLVGSALGARIGSAATAMVDEDEVIVYFGIMMLLASAAIALSEIANWLAIGALDVVSVTVLVGSAFFVGSMILYHVLKTVRGGNVNVRPVADGDD